MALIERRRLMIDLSDEHLPRELDFDDDYANYLTALLGQVINHCFDNARPLEAFKRERLRARLETWHGWLPESFELIMAVGDRRNGAAFPMMGALHGWHG